MPYAKRRYRRRKSKKSVGKSLLRDAKKRGTNSALEKAVKLISKRQAKALMPANLCFRRYLFADYDWITNTFENYTDLDMTGEIVHVVQIPIMDNATVTTVDPTSDIDLRPEVPQYNRGAHTIAPFGQPMDGYRMSHKVSLGNININMRFLLDPLVETTPAYSRTKIRWALIATHNQAQDGLTWSPPVNQVLPRSPVDFFGYSSRLDTSVANNSRLFKWHVLQKGHCYMSADDYRIVEKRVSIFHEFKRRLTYEFQNDDRNGQRVVGSCKIFLVIRNDLPISTPTAQKPKIAAVCKVGYKDC